MLGRPGWSEGQGGELPRVEVTQEQIEARLAEWVEQAKLHAGEPVLTYSRRRILSHWPLHLGRVRSDLNEEIDVKLSSGIALAETPTITSNGRNAEDSKFDMRVGFMEAYDSFQREPVSFSDTEGVPRFQIVFGHEPVAAWFIQNNHPRRVEPFSYVQMAKHLGFEPVQTPEIAESVAKRCDQVITQLVKLALEQSGLSERIDAVYKSIGTGSQSLHGGLMTGMAPESKGEANLRTYEQRRQQDRNNAIIEGLKQGLVDLGVDEAQYYRAVAWLLGLDLFVEESPRQ